MAENEYPPSVITAKQTSEEEASPTILLCNRIAHTNLFPQKNIALCKEYMSIAYSPTKNTGGDSVSHLCHADSWFWAPATFPGCQTPMDYAASHSTVMASVNDLRIVRFDQAWAKDGHVLLRYTAEGSHSGEPYKGIPPSERHARWCAAAIFEVEDGKIRSFTKDWDQKTMQVSLGLKSEWCQRASQS